MADNVEIAKQFLGKLEKVGDKKLMEYVKNHMTCIVSCNIDDFIASIEGKDAKILKKIRSYLLNEVEKVLKEYVAKKAVNRKVSHMICKDIYCLIASLAQKKPYSLIHIVYGEKKSTNSSNTQYQRPLTNILDTARPDEAEPPTDGEDQETEDEDQDIEDQDQDVDNEEQQAAEAAASTVASTPNHGNPNITKVDLELAMARHTADVSTSMTTLQHRIIKTEDENRRLNLLIVKLQKQIDDIKEKEASVDEAGTETTGQAVGPVTEPVAEIAEQTTSNATGTTTVLATQQSLDNSNAKPTVRVKLTLGISTIPDNTNPWLLPRPTIPPAEPTAIIRPEPVRPTPQPAVGQIQPPTTLSDPATPSAAAAITGQQPQPTGAAVLSTGNLTTTGLASATRLSAAPKLEHIFLGNMLNKWKETDIMKVLYDGADISSDMIEVGLLNKRPSFGKAFKVSVPANKVALATAVLKSCD